MKRFCTILLLSAFVFVFPFTGCASSDWKPQNTIKIIVPFSAGGGADLMARAIAPKLSNILGTSVVVENATGGSGAIAMSKLARSKPDGYTLIYTSVGPCTLTPISSDVGYTNKEFIPIAQMVDVSSILCVHKDSGIKTFPELLKKAEETKEVNFGTPGAGLIQSVQLESLFMEMGKPGLMIHVPFNGGSQAVAALLGKQIDAVLCIIPEVKPHIKNGTFVALANTGVERYGELPDVPTLKDLGYRSPGGVWYGFAAPAKTPDNVISTFAIAFKKISEDPEIVDVFAKLGNDVIYLDQKAFTEKWMETYKIHEQVLKALRKD